LQPLSGRLVTLIRSTPDRLRIFFRDRPVRQWLWIGSFSGFGFYSANVITLTFATLSINDVAAAATCVALVEFLTYLYYTAKSPTLTLTLLNAFKIGFTAAMINDCLKLGG